MEAISRDIETVDLTLRSLLFCCDGSGGRLCNSIEFVREQCAQTRDSRLTRKQGFHIVRMVRQRRCRCLYIEGDVAIALVPARDQTGCVMVPVLIRVPGADSTRQPGRAAHWKWRVGLFQLVLLVVVGCLGLNVLDGVLKSVDETLDGVPRYRLYRT